LVESAFGGSSARSCGPTILGFGLGWCEIFVAVELAQMIEKSQRSDIRSQKSEVRGQKSDVRNQMSEVRGQILARIRFWS